MNKTMNLRRVIMVAALLLFAVMTINAQQVWYDPMDCDTPHLCGRAWNVEIGRQSYHRIPDRFASTLPKNVWGLSHQTAGESVKFQTTSRNIVIRYTLANRLYSYLNMATLNHSGIDVYATDANGSTHWIGNHMRWKMPHEAGDTIEFRYDNISIPEYDYRGLIYEIFLPPYNEVKSMQIGVDKGSEFTFVPESAERPIVIYGSSIVQGASPSRPGLMWTNIIKRRMQYPVINMGFSGSALMEPGVFDMLSEINARVFVLDPIPNSYSLAGDEIVKRAVEGIRKLRQKSDAPILMVENYNSPDSVFRRSFYDQYHAANMKYREAYKQLKAEGLKDLYYLYDYEINFTEDAMIECAHPNDLGNTQYADAVEKKLREILVEDTPDSLFPPIQQFRDGSYVWMERHNQVMQRNQTIDPQVLFIGNSITNYWGGEPRANSNGPKSWKKLFGKYRVTNMGFGWDKIENVYWRIFHGELEGCKPQHVFINIGINNRGQDVQKVATGIINVAKLIRKRQPQARLHVVQIYPARDWEEWGREVNTLVRSQMNPDGMTDIIDCSPALSTAEGKINESLFLDGIHPSEEGYSLIAGYLKKVLTK